MRRIRTAAATIPEYSVIPDNDPDLTKKAILEGDVHTLNGIEHIMNEHRGEPMLYVERKSNEPLLLVAYSTEGFVSRKLSFVPTEGVWLYKPTPTDDSRVETPESIKVPTLTHIIQYGLGANQRPWQKAPFDFWFPYNSLMHFSYDERVIGSIPRSFGNNHTPSQLIIGREEVGDYFRYALGDKGNDFYISALQKLADTGKATDVPDVLEVHAA